jgi:hypothetical protein
MSRKSKNDITLQINLCAGDVRYCEAIVPVLIQQYGEMASEVLVVFDTCRPQSTPFVHKASRFPADQFAVKIGKLEKILQGWLASGLIDRIVRMDGEGRDVLALNEKYTGVASDATHDHHGHASTAYYLAWDAPRTRYVLHFDGDILIHQDRNSNWVEDALHALERNPKCLAVIPRISPPEHKNATESLVNLSRMPQCGWLPTWPLREGNEGWFSHWFSTRCHFLDRHRLAQCLPLVSGAKLELYKTSHRANRMLEPLIRQRSWISYQPETGWRRPGRRLGQWLAAKVPFFPLPPEVLIHERNVELGMEVLYMNSPHAWFIHPHSKPEEFYELLPDLLRGVEKGVFPPEQAGMSEIDLDAWKAFSKKRQ